MDTNHVMLSATFIFLCFSLQLMAQGNVGIGTISPAPTAALDINSTTQGLLPPRMTETQRDDIVSPADGLMIFNTNTGCIDYYFSGSWFEICGNQLFTCPNSTIIVDVINPITGKIWMDRNLGASQVAVSSTDENSYGDLYQWGRGADGHQCRNSDTTSTLSSSDQPGHGDFIINTSNPFDWRSPQNTNLWQGVNGVNNPCPSGYRLPTATEADAERLSWSSNNAMGAFASPLKLPVAGNRNGSDGSIISVGTGGIFWSSTVGGTGSLGLYFGSSNAYLSNDGRRMGYSVRCLKD